MAALTKRQACTGCMPDAGICVIRAMQADLPSYTPRICKLTGPLYVSYICLSTLSYSPFAAGMNLGSRSSSAMEDTPILTS